MQSVHGQGPQQAGRWWSRRLCADCHGAHGIYRAADKRSTLHPTHVAATCGKCHRFIEERLQASVHGGGGGPGGLAKRMRRAATRSASRVARLATRATTCPTPSSAGFRRQLPNRCGNCHADLSSRYALTSTASLTELGYGPAAKCSDCHGAHDILAVSDPNSPLSPRNRAADLPASATRTRRAIS